MDLPDVHPTEVIAAVADSCPRPDKKDPVLSTVTNGDSKFPGLFVSYQNGDVGFVVAVEIAAQIERVQSENEVGLPVQLLRRKQLDDPSRYVLTLDPLAMVFAEDSETGKGQYATEHCESCSGRPQSIRE